MPNYDYECASCNKVFEIFQSMSDEPLKECPECGGEVKRLVGGGLGIIFKGSGFYVTDNKKSGTAGAGAGSGAGSSSSAAAGAGTGAGTGAGAGSASAAGASGASGASSNAAPAAAAASSTSGKK